MNHSSPPDNGKVPAGTTEGFHHIPQLELAGALEAVRLSETLRKELDIELQPAVFWTDSTIVLRYINYTEKRFQTYVANRVTKIISHTDPHQ